MTIDHVLAVVAVSKGVRLCSLEDPDINTITLIGSFREHY